MSQPTYKFKWSNVNLDDYLRERRLAASHLRRDAEILLKQAETIETEMSKLQVSLVDVEEGETDK